jgi:hypothetical protein
MMTLKPLNFSWMDTALHLEKNHGVNFICILFEFDEQEKIQVKGL